MVLKAYLQAQGWSDARYKNELGHHIALALMACKRDAFTPLALAHRDLIFCASPFSRRHDVAGSLEVHAKAIRASKRRWRPALLRVPFLARWSGPKGEKAFPCVRAVGLGRPLLREGPATPQERKSLADVSVTG